MSRSLFTTFFSRHSFIVQVRVEECFAWKSLKGKNQWSLWGKTLQSACPGVFSPSMYQLELLVCENRVLALQEKRQHQSNIIIMDAFQDFHQQDLVIDETTCIWIHMVSLYGVWTFTNFYPSLIKECISLSRIGTPYLQPQITMECWLWQSLRFCLVMGNCKQ